MNPDKDQQLIKINVAHFANGVYFISWKGKNQKVLLNK